MLFVCPSLYREKWLLQKLFDFPLPFLSSSFKKPKQDFILCTRKIEILSITMVLHFWETSCRYQGCQLWGLGERSSLVWWLKGTLLLHYNLHWGHWRRCWSNSGAIISRNQSCKCYGVTWHEQWLARNCIVWHLHFSLSKLLIVDINLEKCYGVTWAYYIWPGIVTVWRWYFIFSRLLIINIIITLYEMNEKALGNNQW